MPTPTWALPSCHNVFVGLRTAQLHGQPAIGVQQSSDAVAVVYLDGHIVFTHSDEVTEEVQKRGGVLVGACTHSDLTEQVWAVPGFPPHFSLDMPPHRGAQ